MGADEAAQALRTAAHAVLDASDELRDVHHGAEAHELRVMSERLRELRSILAIQKRRS